MHTRTRANIDDIVRSAHGVFVVLNNKDSIAQITQMAQCIQQLIVVALVQTDRRLIEDIQNAHEARTDLRGKADTLALAAGERCRCARKREIAQTHRLQKAETGFDLAQNLLGNHGEIALQLQILYKRQRVGNRQAAKLHNIESAHRHGQTHI